MNPWFKESIQLHLPLLLLINILISILNNLNYN